jgi:hypothetical protein
MKPSQSEKATMSIRYVCTPAIVFDSMGQQYACEPEAICDSAIEAAKANIKLHSAFGYAIYKVDESVKKRLKLAFGLLAGRTRTGLKVIEFVGQSYEILEEAGLSFSEMRKSHDAHWEAFFSGKCSDHPE